MLRLNFQNLFLLFVLDLLNISKETKIEMITDGKRLILQPINEKNKFAKIKAATRRVMKNHDKTLRELAKRLNRNFFLSKMFS